jgi:hypothetical protein
MLLPMASIGRWGRCPTYKMRKLSELMSSSLSFSIAARVLPSRPVQLRGWYRFANTTVKRRVRGLSRNVRRAKLKAAADRISELAQAANEQLMEGLSAAMCADTGRWVPPKQWLPYTTGRRADFEMTARCLVSWRITYRTASLNLKACPTVTLRDLR